MSFTKQRQAAYTMSSDTVVSSWLLSCEEFTWCEWTGGRCVSRGLEIKEFSHELKISFKFLIAAAFDGDSCRKDKNLKIYHREIP